MAQGIDNFLAHHGIQGQKWGIRHGPPYPLNKSVSNSVKNSKFKDTNTKTEGIIKNYGKKIFSNPLDADIIETEERVRPNGKVIHPSVAKVIKDFEEAGLDNPYPRETGFDDLLDSVNPNYGEPGTTNNCTFVTAAAYVASKGYNVVARRSLGGASATALTRWFDGAVNEECQDFNELKQDILKDGNGSCGVIQGYYGDGLGSGMGGHAVNYRMENDKIIVSDYQNHSEFDFDDLFDHYNFNPGKNIRTRLDTTEPNWDTLAEDGVLGVNNGGRRWKRKSTGDVYSNW